MTSHMIFILAASLVLVLWSVALIGYVPAVIKQLRFPLGTVALVLGWLVIVAYMAWLWHVLERPPMRTQGETHLWYTICLPAIGLLVQWRWKTRAVAIPTILMGLVFLILTLCHPESLDKSMMPALRSPWFAPHVIIYMAAYATLGIAALLAAWSLVRSWLFPDTDLPSALEEVQRLIYIALPLMTLGMILGAYWAKIAWGHYWGWDPKETWAFISWAVYISYIHVARYIKLKPRTHLALVAVAFIALLLCWSGVNMLPTAQMSAHTYSGTN